MGAFAAQEYFSRWKLQSQKHQLQLQLGLWARTEVLKTSVRTSVCELQFEKLQYGHDFCMLFKKFLTKISMDWRPSTRNLFRIVLTREILVQNYFLYKYLF